MEVPQDAVPPAPEGTFYYFQMLDMAVYTTQGEHLGTVIDILKTGANDVYVVRQDDQEVLVPAVADVVVEVNVEEKRMVVALPKGLR